jgi:hypothetical protein
VTSEKYTPTKNEQFTSTEDQQFTTRLTVTSCRESKCATSEITTGVTIITAIKAGVVTTYTTWCRLTTTLKESSAESFITVIATGMYSTDVYFLSEMTTGLTVLTTAVEGMKTTYTTYCPIKGEVKKLTPSVSATSVTKAAVGTTASASRSSLYYFYFFYFFYFFHPAFLSHFHL